MKRIAPTTSIFLLILAALPASASAFSIFPGEGGSDYREFIINFYVFALPAAALVGVVLIMIAGVIWITSAGSQQRIATAKEYIINSIIGIILLMGAYVILGFINPNLVLLSFPSMKDIGKFGACYTPSTGECFLGIKEGCESPNVFREGQDCQDDVGKAMKAEQDFLASCETITEGDLDLGEDQFDPVDLRQLQQTCNVDVRQLQFDALACVGRYKYANNIEIEAAGFDCENRCNSPCTHRFEIGEPFICFCENSSGFSGFSRNFTAPPSSFGTSR